MTKRKNPPDSRQKRKNKKERNIAKKKQSYQFNEDRQQQIHPGSFANPALREQFQVDLPTVNLPETTSKKRVVLFLGYLGTRYGGFQINEGQRTLQAELELAFYKGVLMDPRNFGYPHKYGFSISGRTDKGVHACAQVVSAKLEVLPDQTMDQVRETLNAALPDDVAVFDVVQTTRSFCAHTQRDQVRYQYMIPSFLLASKEQILQGLGLNTNEEESKMDWSQPLSEAHRKQLQAKLKDYRATPEQLERLQQALAAYEGTHPFHNFTRGVQLGEGRAKRYIISFSADAPVVQDDGYEWIPTQVLGQSFLLNQIRKMIGLAVEVARNDGASLEDLTQRALQPTVWFKTSLAPAQGLFLDMSYFTGYNRRKENSNADLMDLDWTREESAGHQRWKAFRNTVLLPHIFQQEVAEGNFVQYLVWQTFVFQRNTNKKGEGNHAEDSIAEDDNHPDKSDQPAGTAATPKEDKESPKDPTEEEKSEGEKESPKKVNSGEASTNP